MKLTEKQPTHLVLVYRRGWDDDDALEGHRDLLKLFHPIEGVSAFSVDLSVASSLLPVRYWWRAGTDRRMESAVVECSTLRCDVERRERVRDKAIMGKNWLGLEKCSQLTAEVPSRSAHSRTRVHHECPRCRLRWAEVHIMHMKNSWRERPYHELASPDRMSRCLSRNVNIDERRRF